MKLKTAGFYYFAASITRRIVPFLLLPVLIRVLGIEGYGKLGLFLAAVAFVSPIIDLGASSYVMLRCSTNQKIANIVIRSALQLLLLNSAGFSFILLIILASGVFPNLPLGWDILLIPSVVFVQGVSSVFMAVIQAKQKVIAHSIFFAITGSLDLISTLFFVVVLNLGWQGRLYAMLGANLLSIIVLHKYVNTNIRVFSYPDRSEIIDMAKYGIASISNNFSREALASIDRFFLAAIVSTQAVGLYTAAYQISAVIGLLNSAFMRAWNPKQFKILSKPIFSRHVYRKVVMRCVGVTITIHALYAIAIMLTLPFLLGAEFVIAVPYVPWIVAGVACSGISQLPSSLLFYLRKLKLLAILFTVSTVINLISNWVLLPRFGTIGAAYATFISYFSLLLSTSFIAIRFYNTDLMNRRKIDAI